MFTWSRSMVLPLKRVLIPIGVLLLHGRSPFHNVPFAFDLVGLSLCLHGLRTSSLHCIRYGVYHTAWSFYHTPISSPRVSRVVCKLAWKLKYYVEPPTFMSYDRSINLQGLLNLCFVLKCRDMITC